MEHTHITYSDPIATASLELLSPSIYAAGWEPSVAAAGSGVEAEATLRIHIQLTGSGALLR